MSDDERARRLAMLEEIERGVGQIVDGLKQIAKAIAKYRVSQLAN